MTSQQYYIYFFNKFQHHSNKKSSPGPRRISASLGSFDRSPGPLSNEASPESIGLWNPELRPPEIWAKDPRNSRTGRGRSRSDGHDEPYRAPEFQLRGPPPRRVISDKPLSFTHHQLDPAAGHPENKIYTKNSVTLYNNCILMHNHKLNICK